MEAQKQSSQSCSEQPQPAREMQIAGGSISPAKNQCQIDVQVDEHKASRLRGGGAGKDLFLLCVSCFLCFECCEVCCGCIGDCVCCPCEICC